jgi:hypothetical protein
MKEIKRETDREREMEDVERKRNIVKRERRV